MTATTAGGALLPRDQVPLLAAHPGLHYLDSAATTQKPLAVLDAERAFYSTANANPHRGAYALSVAATDALHDARAAVARFLGVGDPACCLFTRGTTEALNLVARSWGEAHVRAGDEVVVTALEHHANFVPWQQLARRTGATLRIVPLTARQEVDLDALAAVLGARTRVVAVTHVSNAVGAVTPLEAVVALVRARSDALLVVDGAQGAPHLPVAFDALGADFYACSGHKLLGPMGVGVLAGRRAVLEAMPPWHHGGDMIEVVGDEDSTWNVLPHRFEAGTPNAAGAVALAAAVRVLEGIGVPAIRAHEVALLARAEARLQALPGVTIYGPPAAERSGVLSFTVDGVHPHDLATILDQHGVCIRAGHHCAQPLMRRLEVPATARASFYVYSDEADADALADGVADAVRLFGVG
ncbi:MAG: SufS family cysteine desulfurase [Gemmatimonadetes bacterium]|nr:SufS family cysteine desulfurase [Gemmatimonadota bacterium]